MLIVYYMMYAITIQTREIFSCVAAGAFISILPESSNFYYNTALITSVCEMRALMQKNDIHPMKLFLNTTTYDY